MLGYKEWTNITKPLTDDIISHGCSQFRPLTEEIIAEVHSASRSEYDESDFENMLRLHKIHSIPKSDVVHAYTINSDYLKEAMDERINGKQIHPEFRKFVRDLDATIDPHSSKENLKLYSGLRLSPIAQHGAWHPSMSHRELNLRKFTSASTKMSTAEQFARSDAQTFHHESDHHGIILPNAKHIIRFNIPTGFTGIASVMDQSKNPNEFEFLMSRDHKFNVVARPHEIKTGIVRYVWDAYPIEMSPHHYDKFE